MRSAVMNADRRTCDTSISVPFCPDTAELYLHGGDHAYLRLKTRPERLTSKAIGVVDLFSGCGGLTLGLEEAFRNRDHGILAIGVDNDPVASACFARNFGEESAISQDLCSIFDGDIGAKLTLAERQFKARSGATTFLVGGPPCQGHSDLNNFSRRSDPKNSLYLFMARAAEVLQPEHVIIENVPGSAHDKTDVVGETEKVLSSLGYSTTILRVQLAELGVPQQRKRLVLIATSKKINYLSFFQRFSLPIKDVRWAMADLEDSATKGGPLIDEVATSAPSTRSRIAYLFENDLYELPDSQRPPCHRDKRHTYKSIYGRLRWDAPAQTITRGFYSMCMGRFVHPSRQRTLTAHEAARLQFFPDFFDFGMVNSRNSLAMMIGNAVPMKLTYAIGCELLNND